jgi:hypothetical protein
MKINKIKVNAKSFMDGPSKKFMDGPSKKFMDGPSKKFMDGPSKKFDAKPKPKPKRWGDDGYVSPSTRMKNKWRKAKMDSEMLTRVQKSSNLADLVPPTGMGGTAFTEADMARRSAIKMKQNLKTAAKIGGGAVLGAGAAYGASKFKTAPSRDLEKELVNEIKTSRGEKPSSSMNDVDFNRSSWSQTRGGKPFSSMNDVDFNRSKWSQHKKSQRGY